jgi:hypothetical protein
MIIYGNKDENKLEPVFIDKAYSKNFSYLETAGTPTLLYFKPYSTLRTIIFDPTPISIGEDESRNRYNHFDYLDVDNDGNKELIGYDPLDNIYIFKNFLPGCQISGLEKIDTELRGKYIGDLNNDNHPDFLILLDDKTQIVNLKINPRFVSEVVTDIDCDITTSYKLLNYYNNILPRDYNKDGKQDLLVPTHSDTHYAYKAITLEGQTPVTSTQIRFDKNNFRGLAYYHSFNLGDINGNGKDEIAFLFNSRIDIYSNGNLETPLFTLNKPEGEFRFTKIEAGDLNQDGYSDFIVGIRNTDDFSQNRIEIYYGGSNPSPTPAKQINIAQALSLSGTENVSYYENSFNLIGSIDGDEYPELIMFSTVKKEMVYIFKGAATFPESPHKSINFEKDATHPDFESVTYMGFIGSRALSLGDINKDGINDFVLSDCGRTLKNSPSNGCLYVFYGNTSLDFSVPDKFLYDAEPNNNTENFGMHLTTGDYNGDGKKDIATVASSFKNQLPQEPLAGIKIYFGGKNMTSTPDKEIYVKAKNLVSSEIKILDDFRGALMSVPDVNGDGTDELLIQLGFSMYRGDYLYLGSKTDGISPDPIGEIKAMNEVAYNSSLLNNSFYFSDLPNFTSNFSGKGVPELITGYYDPNYPGNVIHRHFITNPFNTAPTDISTDVATIMENQPKATVVGTLAATDTDKVDFHSFSLTTNEEGNAFDNDNFEIIENQLQSKIAFDFETKQEYTINVEAKDADGKTVQKLIVIKIEDVNEAPTDITISNTRIEEKEEAGLIVGTLAASDPDTEDTFTFSLAKGDGTKDADNSLFEISENELKTREILDFDTKNELSVLIQVEDAKGLSFQKVFLLDVTNKIETGVNDLHVGTLEIYPNPASEHVFISLPEDYSKPIQLELYSLTGQKLFEKEYQYQTNIDIPLKQEWKGMVLLVVSTEDKTIKKKLIVK